MEIGLCDWQVRCCQSESDLEIALDKLIPGIWASIMSQESTKKRLVGSLAAKLSTYVIKKSNTIEIKLIHMRCTHVCLNCIFLSNNRYCLTLKVLTQIFLYPTPGKFSCVEIFGA